MNHRHLSLLALASAVVTASTYAQNWFPSTGNVGIEAGTAPGNRLTVFTPNSNDGLLLSGNTGHLFASVNATQGAWNPLTQAGDILLLSRAGAPDSASTPGLVLGPWSGSPSGIRITRQGWVGIGEKTPSTPLQVSRLGGAAGTWLAAFSGSDTWHNGIRLDNATSGSYGFFVTGASHSFGSGALVVWQHASSSPRMLFDASGNVGIGTTAPDSRLTIQGDPSAPTVLNVGGDSNGRLRVRHLDGKHHVSRATDSLYLQYGIPHSTIINGGGSTGFVGVGTDTPTHRLTVNGTIRAKEVIVDSGWADHVFTPAHRLAPLAEVEQHIAEHGRLPGMPSAAQVESEGIAVSEAQRLLLEKVEELTLHVIAQAKAAETSRELITIQAARIEQLSAELAAMKRLVRP